MPANPPLIHSLVTVVGQFLLAFLSARPSAELSMHIHYYIIDIKISIYLYSVVALHLYLFSIKKIIDFTGKCAEKIADSITIEEINRSIA